MLHRGVHHKAGFLRQPGHHVSVINRMSMGAIRRHQPPAGNGCLDSPIAQCRTGAHFCPSRSGPPTASDWPASTVRSDMASGRPYLSRPAIMQISGIRQASGIFASIACCMNFHHVSSLIIPPHPLFRPCNRSRRKPAWSKRRLSPVRVSISGQMSMILLRESEPLPVSPLQWESRGPGIDLLDPMQENFFFRLGDQITLGDDHHIGQIEGRAHFFGSIQSAQVVDNRDGRNTLDVRRATIAQARCFDHQQLGLCSLPQASTSSRLET